MSYEDALEQVRADLEAPVEVPAFARVDAAVRWHESATQASRPPAHARWLATAGAAIAALTFMADAGIGLAIDAPIVVALFLPVVLLVGSAALVHRADVGSQLLARAIWWAALLLGVAWSAGPVEALPAAGSLVAVGAGFALFAVGRSGLRRSDTARVFDPVAFRGTVMLSMLLGLADAVLLGLLGITFAEAGADPARTPWLLVASGLLGLGVWGLYRLRVWAVGLNLLVNAGVLTIVLLLFAGSSLVPWLLGVSAALQLVLPTRMCLAFFRGAQPKDRHTELPGRLSFVTIGVMMAAAVFLGLFNTYATTLQ